MKKVKIELQDWYHECGDGCCTEWGTDIFVNGELMESNREDLDSALKEVLTHLGFDVEIVRKPQDE